MQSPINSLQVIFPGLTHRLETNLKPTVTKENPIGGKINWRYIIMYNDKTLTCRDCGTSFAFTASEQTFFAEKGFTNEPSRCPGCRSSHRNSGNNSGGSRGGYNENRTMHDVVCAECGRNTQVPFLPSNDRPVYCSDCFKNHNPRNR